jgi:hypothetical protein
MYLGQYRSSLWLPAKIHAKIGRNDAAKARREGGVVEHAWGPGVLDQDLILAASYPLSYVHVQSRGTLD